MSKKKTEAVTPNETLVYCKKDWRSRTLIFVPTEGWVRYEWAAARYSQVVPINYQAYGFDLCYTALGFSIDDAYNRMVKEAIERDVEWVITIEDDVLLHPKFLVKMGHYQDKGDTPIVSGLYYIKAEPTAPLVFRGRGNGPYADFKIGDKVWCDGLPMGCLMIHSSILRWMWDNSEEYQLRNGEVARRVFETPRKVFFDHEIMGFGSQYGTQDLYFFDRIMKLDVFKKTGWPKIARKKYPFLCDTSIFCGHIDRKDGAVYPLNWSREG
jgi:hypothetical protein